MAARFVLLSAEVGISEADVSVKWGFVGREVYCQAVIWAKRWGFTEAEASVVLRNDRGE